MTKKIATSAFFVTTPYQIIGALLLANEMGNKPDIYVINQFKSADSIIIKLKNSKVFDNVVLVDEKEIEKIKLEKNKLLKLMKMFIGYFSYGKVGDKYLVSKNYSKVYVTCQAYMIRLLVFNIFKRSKESELIIFDDGVGSYYNEKIFKVSRLDSMFRNFLIGNKFSDFNVERYLYEPELASDRIRQNSSLLSQMPKALTNFERSLIKEIFDVQDMETFNTAEYILIDTLVDEIYGGKYKDIISSIYRSVETILTDKLVYKKHPRDKIDQNFRFECLNSQTPIEAFFLENSEQEKIYLTINSTAVCSSVMLLNKPIVVIFLYKIVGFSNDDENSFFEKFQSLAVNKDYVSIPESIEELQQILREKR